MSTPRITAFTGARLAQRLDALAAARDWSDLSQCCEGFARDCGYDQFLYAFELPHTERRYSSFVLTNYPPEWLARYTERRYVESDPVVARGVLAMLPFEWSELVASSPDAANLLLEATEFGLHDGLTTPVHGPDGALGLFNLASDEQRVRGRAHRANLSAACLLFGAATMDRARRIAQDIRTSFSARQALLDADHRRLLEQLSTGCDLQDAAATIGITPSTAQILLDEARHALSAETLDDLLVSASIVGLTGWLHRAAPD